MNNNRCREIEKTIIKRYRKNIWSKFAEDSLNNQDKNKSKRLYIKNLIKKLSEDNKFLENNIFKCVDNINLDAIMGYHSEKGNYYFLDDYEKRG